MHSRVTPFLLLLLFFSNHTSIINVTRYFVRALSTVLSFFFS